MSTLPSSIVAKFLAVLHLLLSSCILSFTSSVIMNLEVKKHFAFDEP